MKINIPEVDKNMHLYLGYLGFNGPYAVCRQIAEWIKAVPNDEMSYFQCRGLESNKKVATRFIEANNDNFEVMKYLNELL